MMSEQKVGEEWRCMLQNVAEKDHSAGNSKGTGKEVLEQGEMYPGYSKDLHHVCALGLCGRCT